jgi:Flp pilus assembly protein TadD
VNHLSTRLALALCICICPTVAFTPPVHAAGGKTEAGASTRNLFLMLIRQARDDGHARAALAFLDDFEREFPGDTDALILRINCLLDLDQVEEAQAAAANLPVHNASGPVHAVQGHVLAAAGNWDGAIAEYSAALQTIPSDALTINALGYSQMRAGHTDAAVETFRRARELAPQDTVIRNNLLLALTVAGRIGEADALLARTGDHKFQADLRRQVTDEAARLAEIPRGTERQL